MKRKADTRGSSKLLCRNETKILKQERWLPDIRTGRCLGLDVAMDDIQLLGGLKGACDLHHDLDGTVRLKASCEGDGLTQVTAVDVVHHQKVKPLLLIEAAVMDGDEVRMTDARGDLRLTEEALDVASVLLRDGREQDLHRIEGVQHLVTDEIDRAKAAVAQQPFDDVAVELLAGLEDVFLAEIHSLPPIFKTTIE